MLLEWLLLALGIAVLVGGGELLVRGASDLARALGVPPLVIGLTVVAFGTSAPELAVNLTAALRGSGGIAFGNVVGSNLANVGLVLGITALVRPLAIRGEVTRREIPLVLLATATALVMALPSQLGGGPAELDRTEGLVLLLLFGTFLYVTVQDVVRGRTADAFLLEATARGEAAPRAPRRRASASLLLVALGLVGLLGGGHLIVESATEIALGLGIPDDVVALTVIAIGTSLPELTTALVAARRDEADLAVGNVLGSNVFNLLFVISTTVVVKPISVPAGGAVDLGASLVLSALLLPIALTRGPRISRGEGAVLLVLWIGYGAWRALGG